MACLPQTRFVLTCGQMMSAKLGTWVPGSSKEGNCSSSKSVELDFGVFSLFGDFLSRQGLEKEGETEMGLPGLYMGEQEAPAEHQLSGQTLLRPSIPFTSMGIDTK